MRKSVGIIVHHSKIICIYMVCLNMEIKQRKYDANNTYDMAFLEYI